MTESGVEAEFVNLSMSVVGYEVEYGRSGTDEPKAGFQSNVTLALSVKGATVEHHQNAPVKRVVVNFPEVPGTDKLGHLMRQPGEGAVISIWLPETNFAAVWAALRLIVLPRWPAQLSAHQPLRD